MKKLIYTRADGGVSIVVPASKTAIEVMLGELTDAQYEAHVREKSIPADAINVTEIEDEDIFTDREFRNAWMQNANKLDYDLEKARILQLERIRMAREPMLSALDKEFMMAFENKDESKQTEVATAKQKLRDITEPLKSMDVKSIDDIKGAFPQELK